MKKFSEKSNKKKSGKKIQEKNIQEKIWEKLVKSQMFSFHFSGSRKNILQINLLS